MKKLREIVNESRGKARTAGRDAGKDFMDSKIKYPKNPYEKDDPRHKAFAKGLNKSVSKISKDADREYSYKQKQYYKEEV